MRLAFWLLQDNVQQWQRWVAGLYYVRHCMEAIALLPSEEIPQCLAFVPESLVHQLDASPLLRDATWLEKIVIPDAMLKDLTRRAELRQLIQNHACDVYFPLMTPPIVPLPGRMIGWIADFQHLHFAEFFSDEELRYRQELFGFLGAICDLLVCSSQDVASDLRRSLPQHTAKARPLRFTMRPSDTQLQQDAPKTLERLGVSGTYVYLPYQFWLHKNHATVFDAWRILNQRDYQIQLVCSGSTKDSRRPEHFEELLAFLEKHRLTHQVKILGMVDREDQWQLYRGASLVIQSSLFEGWSTSVEEAKSLGKPLILSDIPVHREQCPDNASFFAPLDPEELADRVAEKWSQVAAKEPWIPTEPVANCLPRVQAFGRTLLQHCLEAASLEGHRTASDILPLYVHMFDEANARLAVIEHLATEVERLRAAKKLAEFVST